MQPHIFIIAGPNGAGKTTAASDWLTKQLHVFEYVNADDIARGLNRLKPETADGMAGRVALERLNILMEQEKNFVFETTLSGKTHARFLQSCIDRGYFLTLTFLWLPTAELAIARVRNRLKQGGHFIPDDIVKRRFHKGLANLRNIYLPLCHSAVVLDSTKPVKKGDLRPRIAEKLGDRLIIHDTIAWNILLREAQLK